MIPGGSVPPGAEAADRQGKRIPSFETQGRVRIERPDFEYKNVRQRLTLGIRPVNRGFSAPVNLREVYLIPGKTAPLQIIVIVGDLTFSGSVLRSDRHRTFTGPLTWSDARKTAEKQEKHDSDR